MKRTISHIIDDAKDIITKKQKIVNPKNTFLPITSHPQQWISATSTRNYIMKDPIIDWLALYHNSFVEKNKSIFNKTSPILKPKFELSNFSEFLLSQGHEFEKYIMDALYAKFANLPHTIVDIGGESNSHSPAKVQDTFFAMLAGVPIIYNAVLHNSDDNTFGIPDLIVRSDWISDICPETLVDDNEKYVTAPLLKSRIGNPKYHYRIIDIKFTTLHLTSDGIHLLNSGSVPAYKSQLCIYNNALAKLQGYNPQKAYLLGRKWEYTKRGIKYKGDGPFEKLGTINFADTDNSYLGKTEEAIKWIKDCRKYGKNWDPLKIGPSLRSELYPNMSNYHDYPWGDIKRKIAVETKELTLLWQVGPYNREFAISKNIYKWNDPNCNSANLGITGKTISPILQSIISTNQNTDDQKIYPKIIKNNDENWQHRSQTDMEFFVDFEFINDIFSFEGEIPAMIFMIGCGYINPLTGRWIFNCFVADSLTKESETKICEKFSEYIKKETHIYGKKKSILVHWSNAENANWNTMMRTNTINNGQMEWFDLLKIFKSEPITIKGCFAFGLKEISKKMYEYKMIETSWKTEGDSSSKCIDGAQACFVSYKAYQTCNRRKIPVTDIPDMRAIVQYNEVDCKVLSEIITYLRNYHCGVKQEIVE